MESGENADRGKQIWATQHRFASGLCHPIILA